MPFSLNPPTSKTAPLSSNRPDNEQVAKPSFARIWWLAARPKTLPAAATPVVVGCACAYASKGLQIVPALLTLIGALLLQLASNFANDVFDFEKGADTAERLGPTRAVQAGWLSPRQMKRGLGLTLVLALLVGVALVSIAGPWLIAIGLVSMLAAVAYTGGPYPLGYNGLGDISVLLFFGFVAVSGTVFVQQGEVTPLCLWASLPVGCLATNILVVNNVRDHETDLAAGKRTLVVRFGRSFGLIEYSALLAIAYCTPLYLWLSHHMNPAALLPLVTLPLAVRLAQRLRRERGSSLNAVLAATAKLLFLYGAVFGVALVVGG